MKRLILILMLLIDLAFISMVLIGDPFRYDNGWTFTLGGYFLLSILVSGFFLRKTKKTRELWPYLTVSVLALSLSSLGWLVFMKYLFLIIG